MTIELGNVGTQDILDLSKLRIIGIVGRAGAGKDTVALRLQQYYENVYSEHFADPLKKACAIAFGIPLSHFHDREIKEMDNPIWETSPRKIAQFVGTEMFRETLGNLLPNVGENFWVARMAGRLNGSLVDPEVDGIYEEGDTVVIPDVRFQNEVNFIERNGGHIIYIERPDTLNYAAGIAGHKSEMLGATFTSSPHVIINNCSLEELYARVDIIANQIGMIKKPVGVSEINVDNL